MYLPPPDVHSRGFGLRKEIIGPLTDDYRGQLVAFARAHGNRIRAGDLRFLLARKFGFCYGVDRAIEYAYETRLRFPEHRIFLTGEIIHNPDVNRRLREFGIRILVPDDCLAAKFVEVRPSDVVLLPAFGVPTDELAFLRDRGCILVDTTCGSVMNVWKNVDRYRQDGFTAIVHGKYFHEETRATASRAGQYLVVKDMEEALEVCRYIEAGADGQPDREAFLERFGRACSPGFDPDEGLGQIGLANQTTMLAGESQAIADELGKAMARRYGEEALPRRFRSFDTICSSTQKRQDAVLEMLAEDLDLVLVIGGFNSSNTGHLVELSSERFPSYHISGADCLRSPDEIRHRIGADHGQPPRVVTSVGWLPEGPLRIGVTSGASTPDMAVHQAIARVLEFRGLTEAACVPDDRT